MYTSLIIKLIPIYLSISKIFHMKQSLQFYDNAKNSWIAKCQKLKTTNTILRTPGNDNVICLPVQYFETQNMLYAQKLF